VTEFCESCFDPILTMAFRGTGVCSDDCRKKRDGDDQAHLHPVVYHQTGFKKERDDEGSL
jgi:hypothetical protein